MKYFAALFFAVSLLACSSPNPPEVEPPLSKQDTNSCDYLDVRTPGTYQTGGQRWVELKEGHRVWTKQFGNNPDMQVLLLHGGPSCTHEYMECFESYFPQADIAFIEYDQLGSYFSDQPEDMSLWTIERFVEEVEQVRQALELDASNFYVYGHSWGGILAMEYALKYQQHMKGLIISNMTADFHKYAAYNGELRAGFRPTLIDSLEVFEDAGDYLNPAYEALVYEHYYRKHLCRLEEWPDAVNRTFKHLNYSVYAYMQGPSEFVPGGILKDWSVWDALHTLSVPTLTVGAAYDTMNPKEMEEMSTLVQHGRYLHCPNGSHMALWDDQEVFMDGVIAFVHDVNEGRFPE